MTRTLTAVALAIAAGWLGTSPIAGPVAGRQTPPAAPRSDRVLVRVEVDGADGAPASGLTQDDFDLRVDGRPQPIAFFSAYEAPLSVILLIDESASMRMGDLASGVVIQRMLDQWFPSSLKPADRARVGTIARRLYLSDRFSTDRRETVRAGFDARTPPSPADKLGPSPIWDAVDAAVSALEFETGLRAVLLLTDGRSTGNRVGLNDATAHAMRAEVAVHVIAEHDAPLTIVQADGSEAVIAPGAGLLALADHTGGGYLSDRPFPWSDPGPLVARLLDSLHHACTIGFDPPVQDGQMHTLEVRARRSGLVVRARKSFVAPGR
jgi:Ca-activated chloride channel family protein